MKNSPRNTKEPAKLQQATLQIGEMDRLVCRLQETRYSCDSIASSVSALRYRFFADEASDDSDDCPVPYVPSAIVERFDYEIDNIFAVLREIERNLDKISSL